MPEPNYNVLEILPIFNFLPKIPDHYSDFSFISLPTIPMHIVLFALLFQVMTFRETWT